MGLSVLMTAYLYGNRNEHPHHDLKFSDQYRQKEYLMSIIVKDFKHEEYDTDERNFRSFIDYRTIKQHIFEEKEVKVWKRNKNSLQLLNTNKKEEFEQKSEVNTFLQHGIALIGNFSNYFTNYTNLLNKLIKSKFEKKVERHNYSMP